MKPATDPRTFFVVWCPSNGMPHVRHKRQADAEAEAARLARLNPGKEFFVLAAMSSTIKDDVRVTQFDVPDNAIPF